MLIRVQKEIDAPAYGASVQHLFFFTFQSKISDQLP